MQARIQMDVRTVLNKNRFKLQDIFLGVSLLSDACSGETWFHPWLNTDLVTR